MKKTSYFAIWLLLSLTLILCSCTTINNAQQSDGGEATETDTTPLFTSYSRFVDKKSNRFGKFTQKVYSSKDLALSVGGELLSLSAIDLEFLPLSLLQNAEKAGGVFSGNAKGYFNCLVTINGDNFVIEYTTFSEKREKISGSFSTQNGYMSCTKTVDEKDIVSMEYRTYGDGYFAQYINYDKGSSMRLRFNDEEAELSIVDGREYITLSSIEDDRPLNDSNLFIREKDGKLYATVGEKEILA